MPWRSCLGRRSMEGKSSLLRRPGKNPELGLVQIAHPVLVPVGAPRHVLVAAPIPTAPNHITAPEVGPVRPVLLLCGPKKHHVLNRHHRRPQHSAPHRPAPHLLTVVISLHCPVCWEMRLWSTLQEADEVSNIVSSLVSLGLVSGGTASLHARSFTARALLLV